MKRLTIEAIHSQAPRYAALDLMRVEWVENPEIFAQALFNWILVRITIVDEFEELLISPIRLLAEIDRKGHAAGDCDDIAMLGASMLASVGAITRFAAVVPQPDGSFSHVIVQYRWKRDAPWVDFDPTIGYARGEYDKNDTLCVDIIS
jgi:transglutaminase-like putative cysteine protease